MMPDAPRDPAFDATDESPQYELRCAACGYSLRGLSGDPRRCPECGAWTPIDVRCIPRAALRWRIAKLIIAAVPSLPGTLLASVTFANLVTSRGRAGGWFLLAIGIGLTIASLLAFRRVARVPRMWTGVFAAVQGCGVFLLFFGACIVAMGAMTAQQHTRDSLVVWIFGGTLILVTAVGAVATCALFLSAAGIRQLALRAELAAFAERSLRDPKA